MRQPPPHAVPSRTASSPPPPHPTTARFPTPLPLRPPGAASAGWSLNTHNTCCQPQRTASSLQQIGSHLEASSTPGRPMQMKSRRVFVRLRRGHMSLIGQRCTHVNHSPRNSPSSQTSKFESLNFEPRFSFIFVCWTPERLKCSDFRVLKSSDLDPCVTARKNSLLA